MLPDGVFHDAGSLLLSDRLSLSFQLYSPNPTDLTNLVQASDDLGTWTPVASKTGPGAWIWLGGGVCREGFRLDARSPSC